MGTYNYNTYDYEFKQALLLLSKFYKKALFDSNFLELVKESETMLNNYSEKILPIERTLSKYDRSTLNGKYITIIKVHPIGKIEISTGEETKTFYLESEGIEERSADSIICDLQNESGINVSKY